MNPLPPNANDKTISPSPKDSAEPGLPGQEQTIADCLRMAANMTGSTVDPSMTEQFRRSLWFASAKEIGDAFIAFFDRPTHQHFPQPGEILDIINQVRRAEQQHHQSAEIMSRTDKPASFDPKSPNVQAMIKEFRQAHPCPGPNRNPREGCGNADCMDYIIFRPEVLMPMCGTAFKRNLLNPEPWFVERRRLVKQKYPAGTTMMTPPMQNT